MVYAFEESLELWMKIVCQVDIHVTQLERELLDGNPDEISTKPQSTGLSKGRVRWYKEDQE